MTIASTGADDVITAADAIEKVINEGTLIQSNVLGIIIGTKGISGKVFKNAATLYPDVIIPTIFIPFITLNTKAKKTIERQTFTPEALFGRMNLIANEIEKYSPKIDKKEKATAEEKKPTTEEKKPTTEEEITTTEEEKTTTEEEKTKTEEEKTKTEEKKTKTEKKKPKTEVEMLKADTDKLFESALEKLLSLEQLKPVPKGKTQQTNSSDVSASDSSKNTELSSKGDPNGEIIKGLESGIKEYSKEQKVDETIIETVDKLLGKLKEKGDAIAIHFKNLEEDLKGIEVNRDFGLQKYNGLKKKPVV